MSDNPGTTDSNVKPNRSQTSSNSFADKLNAILDDPFEELGGIPIAIGAVLGGLAGLVLGFIKAGVGGAIAYCIGGIVVGAIGGFVVGFFLAIFILALPWLLMIGIVMLIVWLIQQLWGVGRP